MSIRAVRANLTASIETQIANATALSPKAGSPSTGPASRIRRGRRSRRSRQLPARAARRACARPRARTRRASRAHPRRAGARAGADRASPARREPCSPAPPPRAESPALALTMGHERVAREPGASVSHATSGAPCGARAFTSVNAAVAAPTPNESSTVANAVSPKPLRRPDPQAITSQGIFCIDSLPASGNGAREPWLSLVIPIGCADRTNGLHRIANSGEASSGLPGRSS